MSNTDATITRKRFSSNDPGAPYSPWGKVDSLTVIARGVRWVGTPSHGGLGVAIGTAKRLLSPAAQACGFEQSGYLWFEEDCLCSIPFFEHPEWYAAVAFVGAYSREETEASIRRWTPEYFDFREGRRVIPVVPPVGATLIAQRDFHFKSGLALRKGESTRVEAIEGRYLVCAIGEKRVHFQARCAIDGELAIA